MAQFKNADHVHADFGGGPCIAHYVSGPHDVGGETKHTIQAPDGSKVNLAHREPADRDAAGSGLTFWAA